MRTDLGSLLAGATILGIALLACGSPQRPTVRPPTDPRLRALWDRALETEHARADALAAMIGELELHAGRLTAHDDRPTAGRSDRIDEHVLAMRVPAEGTTLAIFGARSHLRIALDGTPLARASGIARHGATSGGVVECVDCVVLGAGRVAIDGTFRGTGEDGAPLAITVRGVLERTVLSQLGERELERRLAPALAQRGLERFSIRGSTLALESTREAVDAPALRDGELCAPVLSYRARIEIDLRVLARRSARIVAPPRAFERCCPADGAPGAACRERPVDR